VIPFSLLCKDPSVITNEVYGIVVSNPALNETQPNLPLPLPSAPPLADSDSMQKKFPENERSECPSAPTSGNFLSRSLFLTCLCGDLLSGSTSGEERPGRYPEFYFLFANQRIPLKGRIRSPGVPPLHEKVGSLSTVPSLICPPRPVRAS
jgi:hypothetical protein